MSHNHELIAKASAQIQTDLNKNAGFGLKGIEAPLNQDRINDLIEKVSRVEKYEEAAWVLDEPVINMSQAVVNDTIKTNADFYAKSCLSPKIIRKSNGNCCEWCNQVVGAYDYPYVPQNVYRRHRYCRYIVEYHPGDGRIQNIHSKKWVDPE